MTEEHVEVDRPKAPEGPNLLSAVDHYFGLGASGTTVPTELRAWPRDLRLDKAGMEHGAVFVATCLAAALDRRHGALRQLSDRARAWHGALTMVLTLLLVMLLDTAGTLIGLARQAGLLDKGSRLPRLRQALLADSGGAMLGAALGTSTNTAYIESAAGVEEGGQGSPRSWWRRYFWRACFWRRSP